MKIIEIEAPIWPRKAYVVEENEREYLNFEKDIEVLPAEYYSTQQTAPVFRYLKSHSDGPGWKGGGHECYEENGAKRQFYLDALIVHPKHFKRKIKAAKIRQSKGTGRRGRPKMDPSLKKVINIYVSTGNKRGRPKKDPSITKSTIHVKTGGKRGRPKKNI